MIARPTIAIERNTGTTHHRESPVHFTGSRLPNRGQLEAVRPLISPREPGATPSEVDESTLLGGRELLKHLEEHGEQGVGPRQAARGGGLGGRGGASTRGDVGGRRGGGGKLQPRQRQLLLSVEIVDGRFRKAARMHSSEGHHKRGEGEGTWHGTVQAALMSLRCSALPSGVAAQCLHVYCDIATQPCAQVLPSAQVQGVCRDHGQ